MLLPVWVFSCHYWFELILILILILILVLVLFGYCWIFIFFFDICHVVNIKFIGWYIMYFCYPVFFFLQKFTTWHIDHHPILFFLFNSKQNTEAKTQQNYHTHRGDDWRLFFSKQWRVLVGSLFCCFGKTGSCRREKLAWRCLKLLCQ